MKIGQFYNIQIYGFYPRKVRAKYIGKLQNKTATQNEVHGFKSNNGILGCTAEDLETRVTKN